MSYSPMPQPPKPMDPDRQNCACSTMHGNCWGGGIRQLQARTGSTFTWANRLLLANSPGDESPNFMRRIACMTADPVTTYCRSKRARPCSCATRTSIAAWRLGPGRMGAWL